MTERITVGELIARFLEDAGVATAFGVISIHNMPILDAFGRRGKIRNDRGYGVIRNIQDAQYGARRYYADIHTPDFAMLAQSLALPFHRVRDLARLASPLEQALGQRGPSLIEIDMNSVGPFAQAFAGPPVRKA